MKSSIQSNSLYIFLLSFLTLINIFIYSQFEYKIEELKKNILKLEIDQTKKYAENIKKIILNHKKNKDLYTYLKNNPKDRKKIEENLSLFITPKYKNIFIIRKDDKNRYRFLLDAESSPEDRSDFNQRFHPISNIWDKVFKSSSTQYTTQDKINELWITLLYPINSNLGTEAIIAFDFSIKESEKIVNILNPLKEFFFYLTIMMFAMLVISFSLLYKQYILNKKSNIDSLTKIYNRHYLEHINNKINLHNYELCIIDIDFFKKINDTYGHLTGDEILKSFSNRIKRNIKNDDILIRYGGEEFLLFLYKENKNDLSKVPERLREFISATPISVDNHVINITASFGVNNKPYLTQNLHDALEIADVQLYKAKKAGRNTVIYSHPFN